MILLLHGQYDCEKGLGEWGEFTGDKRLFNPPSLVLKAGSPFYALVLLAYLSNGTALHYCTALDRTEDTRSRTASFNPNFMPESRQVVQLSSGVIPTR